MTADNKYSLLSTDNSMQTIQRLLPQKQKKISELFGTFFKSTLNLENFQKNVTLIV